MSEAYGPTHPVSIDQHIQKYRVTPEETYEQFAHRIASTLSDSDRHYQAILDNTLNMHFMAAGRVQRAAGAPMRVCMHNCFVSGTIKDDSVDILEKQKEAFLTMRMGGGIGYDFSTLRWRGALINSLKSTSSGAVSFMGGFDANCKTVRSAGGRRGAQMGVMRIDHPDIEEFIDAKTAASTDDLAKANMLLAATKFTDDEKALILDIVEKVSVQNRLSAFNVSVAVTDLFMAAVIGDHDFDLVFEGEVVRTIKARPLWEKLMGATWDWAEPGVLFIDRINEMNNLAYCETIAATNPCGEQPLPPYGACLLGSWAVAKFVYQAGTDPEGKPIWRLDEDKLKSTIPDTVRMMDNIIDEALYPLPQQEQEAKNKRRMGLGVTGMANAIEAIGFPYGSEQYIEMQSRILRMIANEAYRASALLAKEKGAFPLYDGEKFLSSKFIQSGVLDEDVIDLIRQFGIRNSHLLSIAPTGTISLTADNMSSGIEPVFAYKNGREIINQDGVTKQYVEIDDYGVAKFGVYGKRADDLTVMEHVAVYTAAQRFVDSSISKTINVGGDVTFEEFKNVYIEAWKRDAKGCTTFRIDGKRFGIMKSLDNELDVTTDQEPVAEGDACMYDPSTGIRSCEA